MKPNRKPKSPSAKASKRLGNSPTRLTLLRLLNPNQHPYIQLDDMKSILNRVPNQVRKTCQQIFYTFIFTTQSFQMPIEEFLQKFPTQRPSPVKSSKKPKHKRPKSSIQSIISQLHPDLLTQINQTQTSKRSKKFPKNSRSSSSKRPRKTNQKLNRTSNTHFQSNYLSQTLSKPKLVPSKLLSSNLRTLSRERTFIKYDQDFIKEVKGSHQHIPRIVKTENSKSVRPSLIEPKTHAKGKYGELRQKREQAKKKQRMSLKPPKIQAIKPYQARRCSFIGVFPDSDKLIQIRKAQLDYSLN